MLNYQCFERLAMSGDSKKSDTVRSYFIKLREFLYTNQKLIGQGRCWSPEPHRHLAHHILQILVLKVGGGKNSKVGEPIRKTSIELGFRNM